jgi:hypothetical protein
MLYGFKNGKIAKSVGSCRRAFYSLINSELQEEQQLNKICVRFEVFMAVNMKTAIFWDVMPCGSC